MQRRTSMLLLVILSVFALAIASPVSAQTSKADVFTFFLADGTPADGHIVGTARLNRSSAGIELSIRTTELVPGDAHSIWWVVFNNPAACDPAGCTDGDFGNPDVEASVLNATGRVASADGGGRFSAFLPVGFMHSEPASGNLRQPFGPGLQNVNAAEIHVVVRSHGPATGSVEQLSTILADCNADDGSGGMVCYDNQAAVFPLP